MAVVGSAEQKRAEEEATGGVAAGADAGQKEEAAPVAAAATAIAATVSAAASASAGLVGVEAFTRGGKEAVTVVTEFSSFKRGCDVFPNVAAHFQAKNK